MDLSVSIFPRYLPPLADMASDVDQVALAAFLEGLQDADFHIRIAACEAIGHLGNPTARSALQAATRDAHDQVRAAAVQALSALDTPRRRAEDMAEMRLVLWRQAQHLETPCGCATTDRRGYARFFQIPADAVCRLQLHSVPQTQPTAAVAVLSLRRLAASRVRGLAAKELAGQNRQRAPSSLPQTQELPLQDGTLACALYRNPQGRVVLELRSDAPQLQGGWVYVTATGQGAQAEPVHEFVALEPDAHNILTGRYMLSEVLDLTQDYAIHCEPIPAPHWGREEKEGQ
jgi:hypothetical protein